MGKLCDSVPVGLNIHLIHDRRQLILRAHVKCYVARSARRLEVKNNNADIVNMLLSFSSYHLLVVIIFI
jgi:hypothetical protein